MYGLFIGLICDKERETEREREGERRGKAKYRRKENRNLWSERKKRAEKSAALRVLNVICVLLYDRPRLDYEGSIDE